MIDIGVTKLAIIGAIALLVIGPEKLPGLARAAGTLLGRARRYVADVKAEVNRSMELDELKKMKETVTAAASEVEKSIQSSAAEFENSWDVSASGPQAVEALTVMPEYKLPKKKWRLKRSATPRWYKASAGVRSNVLSGAARVARFRPTRLS